MEKKGRVIHNKVKVLIVEDSTLFRSVFRETLQSRFPWMETYEAHDSEEALETIEACFPEIVFVDIELPGENGLKLAQKIKARHPRGIIIFLTAYDFPEYREAASEYTRYFLSKGSATREEIFRLLESLLSERSLAHPDPFLRKERRLPLQGR